MQPAVSVNRQQDVVHRVLGRPGLVLLSEGEAERARHLVLAERRKAVRALGDFPVYEVRRGGRERRPPEAAHQGPEGAAQERQGRPGDGGRPPPAGAAEQGRDAGAQGARPRHGPHAAPAPGALSAHQPQATGPAGLRPAGRQVRRRQARRTTAPAARSCSPRPSASRQHRGQDQDEQEQGADQRRHGRPAAPPSATRRTMRSPVRRMPDRSGRPGPSRTDDLERRRTPVPYHVVGRDRRCAPPPSPTYQRGCPRASEGGQEVQRQLEPGGGAVGATDPGPCPRQPQAVPRPRLVGTVTPPPGPDSQSPRRAGSGSAVRPGSEVPDGSRGPHGSGRPGGSSSASPGPRRAAAPPATTATLAGAIASRSSASRSGKHR